jgi:hypothetical protein
LAGLTNSSTGRRRRRSSPNRGGRRCIRLADNTFAHAAPVAVHSAQVKIELITEWSLL